MQGSLPEDETENKKARRSDPLSPGAADKTPVVNKQHLPSPLTHLTTEDSSELDKEFTATPPGRRNEDVTPKKSDDVFSQGQILSSPPQDTQPLSQAIGLYPALSEEIEDEVAEGVWGYLVPLENKYGDKAIVLKKRSACPKPEAVADAAKTEPRHSKGKAPLKEEEAYEKKKQHNGASASGYLIGRHPECGEYLRPLRLSPQH